MRSRNQLFMTFCVVLTMGMVWAYSQFREYFAQDFESRIVAENVEKQLREEKFRRALAESRLRDMSTEVATLLPAKTVASNDKLKQWGQVLREPAAVQLDLSGVIFERAKTKFSEKKFKEALKEFKRLREDYPLSPHAIESAFLSGETAFLLGDTEECIRWSDLMVEQYPENELTGFLLLRIAQISEQNEQIDEASELYRTVQKNFKNPALIDQAKRMAKALELP